MTAAEIEAAYAPFAAALRAGGFSEPDTGWNAGQIGAHIALNSELLSEIAARLQAGHPAAYDNAPVVDDDGLAAYASERGGLPGLADQVQACAARLARAYEALTEQELARPIPAVILHDGQVVRDSPMPLGDLIIGNGDFHLNMHFEQLRALQRPQAGQPGS
jgi:hypothetical protein